MKRNLLIFVIFMAMAGFSRAQVIADYECIPMNVMLGGADDQSTMTVVPNPDASGINTSNYVVKFVRDKNGVPWGGFWSALPTPVDVTVNKYVHVKVWKPRISPIKFKLEGGAAGNLEILSISDQISTGAWEDIVFDFSSKTGTYPVISFMPDFEDPVTLTEDIIIYFDDIMVNNDPTPNTAAAYVIEDYEIMPLNLMIGDPLVDFSSMTLVPNPDPSGINTSLYVIQFLRDKDGVPWGGFWSPTGVDVTTDKYMHVKVWKPRISPIKFKIEGGTAGPLETLSISPQTSTGVWEDMVFDFSSKTGAYPTISFMPDFEDPLTLTENITMYFDDIILNNDPNPTVLESVTMNVNMLYWKDLGIFNPATDFVDVAGTMNGWDGTNDHLTTTNDSIYTITLGGFVAGTLLEFKFRINGSWADSTCEFPSGGPNRTYTVVAGANIYNAWYNNDSTSPVTFKVNMSNYELMGIFHPATDFVDVAGNFNGWDGANHHLTTTDDSIYTITVDSLTFGLLLEFKFRINGSWADSTSEFPSGGPNRTYTVPAGPSEYSAWYNNQVYGIPDHSLTGKVQFYPNPVVNILNIHSTVEINKVVITNTVGQQVAVFENLATGTAAFNISNLDKGLYLITFYAKSGGQLIQKLIKN
ncbi:MAG: T9SS type A sorting domain-containing protein [Bacteroidetes bacterium]|nr:T9SS type A sorting domain-containing protein [Bacteroidota bacterium]